MSVPTAIDKASSSLSAVGRLGKRQIRISPPQSTLLAGYAKTARFLYCALSLKLCTVRVHFSGSMCSHFSQQRHQTRECLIAGGPVCVAAADEVIAEAHESMVRTFVHDWIIEFTGRFHGVCCSRNATGYVNVIPSIEAIYGCVDGGHICRAGAVKT
jgi:hypothetical protein